MEARGSGNMIGPDESQSEKREKKSFISGKGLTEKANANSRPIGSLEKKLINQIN